MKNILLIAFFVCGLSVQCAQAQDITKNITINKKSTVLGKGANTRFDDFAPAIIGSLGKAGDTLVLTSNRNNREQIYIIPLSENDSNSQQEGKSYANFNKRAMQNIGGVVPVKESQSERSFVFASSAAPDKEFARFMDVIGSAIKGGSDLFEKKFKINEIGKDSIKNIEELNSTAWDSHPTVAMHASSGVEMIVFSSDRIDSTGGFSAPYENATYSIKGQERKGNADLFIAFRRFGADKWSMPINLALLQGTSDLNTPFNEYSPFLYCLDGTPHLLFSSNRTGNYELYYALLDIDFFAILDNMNAPVLSVEHVYPLGNEHNDIGSDYDEMFPFVRFQAPNTESKTVTQELFYSSDRFAKLNPDSAKALGYGKLDIYKTEATFFCGIEKPKPCPPCEPCDPSYPCEKPPKPCAITYNVVLLDEEKHDTTVHNGMITVITDGNRTIEKKGNRISIHYPGDSMISRPEGIVVRAVGSSAYDKKPCQNRLPILTNYNGEQVTRTIASITNKVRKEPFDTVVQDKAVKALRISRIYDTVTVEQFQNRPLRKKLNERMEIVDNSHLRIGRDTITYEDSLPPLRKTVMNRTIAYKDTSYTYDTMMIASTVQSIASQLTRFGEYRIPRTMVKLDDSCTTVIVNDTIRLFAQYGQSPCCLEVDSVIVFGSQRNVPYFQTAFWEVNTSDGYREHMQRLREGDLKEASWIELNYRNKYWGIRGDEDRAELMNMRRNDYREKAKIIDRNIKNMVDSTSDLLRKFWKIYQQNDTAKVIITMTAYSDIRPVGNGEFISSKDVQYISSSFDTIQYSFNNTKALTIRNGASLVGQDNDTLSKLRAYYGYDAVMKELSKDSLFQVLQSKGQVLLPTDVKTADDYEKQIQKKRIIVLAEGKYVDDSVVPEVPGYRKVEHSYYDLDGVRRVDVTVRLINMRPDRYAFPDCCVKCK